MESISVDDYEQRLENIAKAVGEFNPTVKAIEENMQFISENKDKIRELSWKVPGHTYIQLHHSKHNEFKELIVKLHDINNNLDQYKRAREHEGLDLPRLKARLHRQETIFKENVREVKELEFCIDKLESIAESCVYVRKGA